MKSFTMRTISAVMTAMATVGCGPAKTESIVQIDTNYDAFVLPLEAPTGPQQEVFSHEFMEQNAIRSSQKSLTRRQTNLGWMPWSYDWIDSQIVLKTTNRPHAVTWKEAQCIRAETVESINFEVNASIETGILPGKGALYLNFVGVEGDSTEDRTKPFPSVVKGEELSKTTDTLIRGMLLAELTARLGEVKALDLQAKTATIFEESRKVVEPIANARGITITSFLPAGGIHFLNEEIQGLIDQRFASERGESNAKLEQAAIQQQNLQMVEKAQAEAVRAEALLASRGAVMARLVREAKKAYAEASSSFYEKWDGKLPADIAPLELLRSFGFNANSSTGSPSDEDVLRLLGIDPETFGMPNEPIKQAPAVPNGSVKPAEASPSQPAAPTEPKKPSDSEQGK